MCWTFNFWNLLLLTEPRIASGTVRTGSVTQLLRIFQVEKRWNQAKRITCKRVLINIRGRMRCLAPPKLNGAGFWRWKRKLTNRPVPVSTGSSWTSSAAARKIEFIWFARWGQLMDQWHQCPLPAGHFSLHWEEKGFESGSVVDWPIDLIPAFNDVMERVTRVASEQSSLSMTKLKLHKLS